MSVDIFVFLARHRAPDFNEWQAALQSSYPDMHFVEPVDLAQHTGYLPASFDGVVSGFELYPSDPKDLMPDVVADVAAVDDLGVAYQFSWGSDLRECVTALRAASALVSHFGGVVYDPQGGQFMTAQQLDGDAKACQALLRR